MRATVVVTAHDAGRVSDLLDCVTSVLGQSRKPDEVIVCVDQNPSLLDVLKRWIPDGVSFLANEGTGLSASRNTALERASGDIITFLDDDAMPAPKWLEVLTPHLDDASVFAAGGPILPIWYRRPPLWLAPEFYWIVGCTARGQYEDPSSIRNLFASNLVFRSSVLREVGGFDTTLGLRLGRIRTGEEAEICLRIRRRHPAMRLVFEPRAKVVHRVYPHRLALDYALGRSYAEGLSKAMLFRRSVETRAVERVLGPEFAFARRLIESTLPSLGGRSGGSELSVSQIAGSALISAAVGLGFLRGLSARHRSF